MADPITEGGDCAGPVAHKDRTAADQHQGIHDLAVLVGRFSHDVEAFGMKVEHVAVDRLDWVRAQVVQHEKQRPGGAIPIHPRSPIRLCGVMVAEARLVEEKGAAWTESTNPPKRCGVHQVYDVHTGRHSVVRYHAGAAGDPGYVEWFGDHGAAQADTLSMLWGPRLSPPDDDDGSGEACHCGRKREAGDAG